MKCYAIVMAAALLLAGCDSGKKEIPKQAGHSSQPTVQHDLELSAAIVKARQTVGTLITALQSPKPNQRKHSVKKPFKVGDSAEHIWLSDVKFDGTAFQGVVRNNPLETKDVKYGDTVNVATNEISDWMFIEDNKLVGGYSVRVIVSRYSPEEKKKFLEGIDFTIEN